MIISPSSHTHARPASQHSAFSRVAALVLGATCVAAVAHAGVVATDTAVPRTMDAGGTSASPAQYIIGLNGAITHSSNQDMSIGDFNSYNELIIRNGSTYTVNKDGASIGWEGSHNTVTVSGPGSRWILGGGSGSLAVGWNGSHNRLVIENGGFVSNTGSVDIGRGDDGRHNSVLVTGAGSVWQSEPIYLGGGGHNSLVIENGGLVTTTYGHSWVGQYSDAPNNEIRVSGAGSAWLNDGGLIFGDAGGNTITLEDGGLLTVNGQYGFIVDADMDNFVRLDGGFLAVSGNRVSLFNSMLADGIFQFWNGSDWESGDASDFTFAYYNNNTAAYDLTGFDDLGGYTIITAAYTSVPEPATTGILVGLGALAFCGARRTRRTG